MLPLNMNENWYYWHHKNYIFFIFHGNVADFYVIFIFVVILKRQNSQITEKKNYIVIYEDTERVKSD